MHKYNGMDEQYEKQKLELDDMNERYEKKKLEFNVINEQYKKQKLELDDMDERIEKQNFELDIIYLKNLLRKIRKMIPFDSTKNELNQIINEFRVTNVRIQSRTKDSKFENVLNRLLKEILKFERIASFNVFGDDMHKRNELMCYILAEARELLDYGEIDTLGISGYDTVY